MNRRTLAAALFTCTLPCLAALAQDTPPRPREQGEGQGEGEGQGQGQGQGQRRRQRQNQGQGQGQGQGGGGTTPQPPQQGTDTGASRLDLKRNKLFRIKVVSAGVPTLSGALDGYSMRTPYKVFDKTGKLVGTGFLGDYVGVDLPGEYSIEVNGASIKQTFDYPPEMTQERAKASWDRERAVELRPKGKAERLAIPAIWVVRPTAIRAAQARIAIEPNPKEGDAPGSTVSGVALSYLPEEIKDRDDGVLYSNTLLHLVPGRYVLKVNKTVMDLELGAGQSKLVSLAGLRIGTESQAEVYQGGATPTPLGAPRSQWFAVAPGKYGTVEKDKFTQVSDLAPGGLARVFELERVFGDKPRLGVKVDDAEKASGAVVLGFVENSPAVGSGLKQDDRIVAVDGSPVKTTDDLAKILGEKNPGDTIVLRVIRKGEEEPLAFTIKLAGQ